MTKIKATGGRATHTCGIARADAKAWGRRNRDSRRCGRHQGI